MNIHFARLIGRRRGIYISEVIIVAENALVRAKRFFPALLCLVLAAAALTPRSVPATAVPGVICIDAGHGGFDPGARGRDSGADEAALNLSVALMLRDELTAAGCKVMLTRGTVDALGGDKAADMAARRRALNASGVILAVSIHMNSFSDRSVSGPMVFYQQGSAEGEALAKLTVDALCDAMGRSRRIANPGDYFVLRECSATAILVECGFLSNSGDELLLQTEAHQRLIAGAIAAAVLAYLDGAR